jgi:hypothetical protein
MGNTIEKIQLEGVESVLSTTEKSFEMAVIDSRILLAHTSVQTQSIVYFQIED